MKITKSKVAICSDIHLGLHQASPVWHNIALDFAKWMKKELLSRGIKDIIIPGDVLHDRNDISVLTLHYLPKFFKLLDGFNIIISVGNHDCYYNNRADVHSLMALNSWPNITVIDKLTTIQAFEKNITFCPWHTSVSDIPECDIIFGHFEIQNFMISGGNICTKGVSSTDILNKAPTVISGHFHTTQRRKYEKGEIIYIGSPYEHNWGEANTPKGIYCLDFDTNELEFIENTISPKHKLIRLSELITAGKMTDVIKKEFKHNIVKFIIDDHTVSQDAIDSMVEKFATLKPLELNVEKIQEDKREVLSMDISQLGVDIVGDMVKFIQNMENVQSPDVICEYLTEIYNRAETLI